MFIFDFCLFTSQLESDRSGCLLTGDSLLATLAPCEAAEVPGSSSIIMPVFMPTQQRSEAGPATLLLLVGTFLVCGLPISPVQLRFAFLLFEKKPHNLIFAL